MGMVFGKINEETPKYELVAKKEHYEVRRYVSYVIAEMEGQAKSQEAFGNANFRVLAQYIGVFGNPQNQKKEAMSMTAPVFSSAPAGEKMAMTAPVMSSAGGHNSGMHSMAFILPSKYNLANAPTPTDDRIKLREVPQSLVAVLTFSGNVEEKDTEAKAERLMEMAKKDGFTLHPDPHDLPLKQGWQLARYNPPFTLPFLKTNEIHVELAEESAAAN